MTNEELIDKTDKAISELVYPKYELQKAYNYYNGIRDADLFRYLEENFGLGNPTSLQFTPLIKKHIDALVGEYLGTPIIPKVFCKDSDTISNIDREKQLKITSELHKFLKGHLKNSILNFLDGKGINDGLIEQQLNKIVEDINNTFISEYEVAAQNVIEYIMQSRDTDILTVLRDILLDLLITGYTFYKVEPTPDNSNIKIKALNPLNVFVDRNIESPYVKNSYRAVVRHWMTKSQILNKYGKEMTKSDKDLLEDHWDSIYDSATYYVRTLEDLGIPSTDGLEAGKEITPGYPTTDQNKIHELVPVFEVEWLEVDKDYIMLRYTTVRIGEEIYILRGKDENVIRSKQNPSYCGLSINGVYFLNRGVEPYSLVLACAHLLDLYDILNFYRNNLIANSGTVGDWIDETLIPQHLGVKFSDRLTKWIALKKLGIGLINSSDEGRMAAGLAPINTIFNGFDDTVKTQAILAIQLAIESIELTASSITGVFRERLNGIELRDAVTNIKIGQNNSFIITKLYYHLMDLIVNEMLLDCLNLAKSVYKNGLTGTIVLGDKYLRVFTALPEYFTLTDHDIRITTSSDVIKDIEYVKQILPEFIKTGSLTPDIILEALTTKSLTDLKLKIRTAMRKLKEENNQILQLAQQNLEMQLLLKLVSSELEKALKKVELLNLDKLQLEQQELLLKNKLEWFKAQTDRDYKNKMATAAEARTRIEEALLYDGNPYNDRVRQIGS